MGWFDKKFTSDGIGYVVRPPIMHLSLEDELKTYIAMGRKVREMFSPRDIAALERSIYARAVCHFVQARQTHPIRGRCELACMCQSVLFAWLDVYLHGVTLPILDQSGRFDELAFMDVAFTMELLDLLPLKSVIVCCPTDMDKDLLFDWVYDNCMGYELVRRRTGERITYGHMTKRRARNIVSKLLWLYESGREVWYQTRRNRTPIGEAVLDVSKDWRKFI